MKSGELAIGTALRHLTFHHPPPPHTNTAKLAFSRNRPEGLTRRGVDVFLYHRRV